MAVLWGDRYVFLDNEPQFYRAKAVYRWRQKYSRVQLHYARDMDVF